MKKKVFKVEEPAAPCTVNTSTKESYSSNDAGVHYVDREAARKITKKVLAAHHGLFRKLAQ